MENPLTAMLLLMATTGNWFSGLSDTKKGITALIMAVLFGFAVGTTAVSQIGLPQRVEALETRVEIIEGIDEATTQQLQAANAERSYILDLLEWQTCAIEAREDDLIVHTACGVAPLRRN